VNTIPIVIDISPILYIMPLYKAHDYYFLQVKIAIIFRGYIRECASRPMCKAPNIYIAMITNEHHAVVTKKSYMTQPNGTTVVAIGILDDTK